MIELHQARRAVAVGALRGEVEHAVARHDPRRVVREAIHKGMMVKILAEEIGTEEAKNVLALLAATRFSRPDFRPGWLK